MIVSFTGSQSTGKTTLLKAMKEDPQFKDWQFEPEITRTLKEKFGVLINEEGNDITQGLIINAHVENIIKHKMTNVVLDRCIIDGYLYTLYLYYTKKVSLEVVNYAMFLHDKLLSKYDIFFYPDPSDVKLVDDGVRSTDVAFRDTMIKLFEEYVNLFPSKVVRLKGTVEERMAIIKKTL